MVNCNAIGILFPNTYDTLVPELVKKRTMASLPFAGRYRMIDFALSGMVAAGISNVTVIVTKNYLSLMDHLGNGAEWDLSRKRNGLNIVPPFAKYDGREHHGRVEELHNVLPYLKDQKEKYVIIRDCNIASNMDFTDLLEKHVESGAHITLTYETCEIAPALKTDNYTFAVNGDGRIVEMRINDARDGEQNISTNVIVLERELLINFIEEAMSRNFVHFERDLIAKCLPIMKVYGYKSTGYRARVYDMKSYFDENQRLLEPENMRQLFLPQRPVFTKVRDEAPARYAMDCKVKHSMIADGCMIEGEVENCVLFRGVKISKGAVVKNCVIMQGTTIEEGVHMDYVVTDKNVRVTQNSTVCGTNAYPVFVDKNAIV